MNLFSNSLMFCLTASVLMASSSAQANEAPSMTHTQKATLVVVGLMLAKFFATEPNNKPVRYDLEAAKAQIQALLNGEEISNNLNELTSFAWYFILDGIIGHASKRASLRVDTATNKVDASPGAYSKGLFGTLHDYAKAPLGIVYLLTALRALVVELPKACDAARGLLNNPANYRKTLEAYSPSK